MPYRQAASQVTRAGFGAMPAMPDATPVYEVHYRPLREAGRVLAFPCDRHGRVDLDALSTRVRNDYFFARALVGREFDLPAVQVR